MDVPYFVLIARERTFKYFEVIEVLPQIDLYDIIYEKICARMKGNEKNSSHSGTLPSILLI